MGNHAEAQDHSKLFVIVWVGLLVLTVIEVFLAYIHLDVHLMMTILIGLSLIKAGMIMAYFMHLKFDKASLTWVLVPPMVACILIMCGYFFPDSYRLLEWRP